MLATLLAFSKSDIKKMGMAKLSSDNFDRCRDLKVGMHVCAVTTWHKAACRLQ